jgi:integrase/recombinase XerD
VRQWSLAPVPRHLQADDLERVIAICGHSTAVELRDRAIVLLLARLGLRASEVARFALEDIDWRGSHLIIRRDKSRRERASPCSTKLGPHLPPRSDSGDRTARSESFS